MHKLCLCLGVMNTLMREETAYVASKSLKNFIRKFQLGFMSLFGSHEHIKAERKLHILHLKVKRTSLDNSSWVSCLCTGVMNTLKQGETAYIASKS